MGDEESDVDEDDLFGTTHDQTPPDTGLVAEQLVNVGLSLLAELVRIGDAARPATRCALVEMLDKIPSLCTQAAAAMRNNLRYAAVMFYERTRLYGANLGGPVNKRCFFNGLPRALPMFGAPVAIQFPFDRMRELTYSDVLNERMHTISKLEKFPEGSPKLNELAQQFDQLPDLPNDVPVRVRIFISRTRTMCEGVRSCKPAHMFRQCQHEQCLRLFMGPDSGNNGETKRKAEGYQREIEYWERMAPMPTYLPDDRRFCSAECARQWWKQLNGLLAKTVDDTDSPLRQLHGACRESFSKYDSPDKALDVAIKRNGLLKAGIVKLKKRRRRLAPAVAQADFDREINARITRSNVDLGVLYAARKVNKVRWHSIGNALSYLPGYTRDWRERVPAGIASRALNVYLDNPSKVPIDDLLRSHAFVRQCGQRAKFVLNVT